MTSAREHCYSAEFASGYRAELTLGPTLVRVAWRLRGRRLKRFLAAYRYVAGRVRRRIARGVPESASR